MSTTIVGTESNVAARLLHASRFQQALGLQLVHADPSERCVSIRLPANPLVERVVDGGQFHGGVIAALIDVAGDLAVAMGVGHGVSTVNFSVDFLRPAAGGSLVATARVRRAGRTLAVADVDVADERGDVVAIGRGCYLARNA